MFDEKGNLIPNYPDPQVLDTGSFQSAPISVSTLTQDQKPLNVIPPVVVPPPVIPKSEPVLTPEPPKPPTAGESLSQRLEDLTAQITGRADMAGERIGAATENYERQLKEINNQIQRNQVEAFAAQEKALESGETLGFAAGEAARVQRNFAIEDMRLSVRAQAMQGNIDLAAKTAQRAVDAEFAHTEKDIEIARQNIIKNYDTFTPAEKKRADATLQRLDKDDAFVKEKKEVRKRISDLVIKLAETGQVPNTVFSQLEKLDSYDEAVKIAAPFLKKEITGQSDFEQAFLRDNGRLPTVQELLDWKAKEAAAGRAPTDPLVGTYIPGSNPTVDNWAKLIISGQAKITEVPNPKGSTLRSDVINAINSSGQLLLSDKDREKLSTLDTAFNVYETIKGLSEKINTFGVTGRVTGYLKRYVGGATQYNTDIARYNATRQGFVSNVARTLGEKGTLAEGDVQRAINNLPTVNDTEAVARGKLETLRIILQGAKDSIIQKSTEPLTGTTSGTIQTTPDSLRNKYNY